MPKNIIRCAWAGDGQLYQKYHDFEWGRPVHDDNRLFELLVLEGMQAGLSWITILRKRENFRRAFDNFDIETVLRYDEQKVESLLQDAGIIRNRLKIQSAIHNAKVFREVQNEYGDQFTAHMRFLRTAPAQSGESTMKPTTRTVNGRQNSNNAPPKSS